MAVERAGDWRGDLDRAAGGGSVVGLSDGELLGRFAARRDAGGEAAFAALVARHGPMVLATCRGRLRRHPGDADDAFQATFLVLARRAGSVRVDGSLGPWLHGVARRVATRALARRASAREVAGAPGDEPLAPPDAAALDARAVVAEEVGRLPAKYRDPVLLCHFEGLAHAEAAQRLGWPVGTVSGRLSRARDLLRDRLRRRGLIVPAAPLAADLGLGPAPAVPPALIRATLQHATASGVVPAALLSLTRGAQIAMTVSKLQAATTAGLALGALALTATYVAGQGGLPGRAERAGLAPPPATAKAIAPRPSEELIRARLDLARRTFGEVGDLILAPPPGATASVHAALRTDQLALWSLRWMEAERDLNPGNAARREALKAHARRLATWDELYVELIRGESNGLTPVDHATVKYHRLQAEGWLAGEAP